MKLSDKDLERIIKRHDRLFQALASKDTLEYDISEWIVHNKEGLKDKIKPLKKEKSDLFPESLYEVYLHQYKEEALSIIKNEVTQALNLNPENALRVSEECVKLVANDLLEPN